MQSIVKTKENYHAQTAEEFSFRKGDEFVLIEQGEEWLKVAQVENSEKVGYIPMSHVIAEDDEEDGLDATSFVSSVSSAFSDYQDDTGDQDYFEERSAWEDEDVYGEKSPVDEPTMIRRRLSKLVRRKSTYVTNDPVTTILAIHQGYKNSLLAQFWHEGHGKPSKTITPQFNSTFTTFRDLHIHQSKKTLLKYKSNICIPFAVLEATGLPSFEEHHEIKVAGYQLRISLYDKISVLSNVHTMKARLTKGIWKFSSKDSILFPSDDENTCIVRTHNKDSNLSLLFELTALMDDAEESGSELVEVCCAWGSLPLYTPEGGKIDSKTYQITLFKGNAMDKQVEAFPPSPQKKLFKFSSNTFPTLHVKLWKLSSYNKKEFGRLPETIVTRFNAAPLIILYRHIFASTVYEKNWEGSLDDLNDPLLTVIPHLADQPKLFRYLCQEWQNRYKLMKRKDKRSLAKKKLVLSDIAMSIWPLISSLPAKISNANQIEIEEFCHQTIQKLKVSSEFWARNHRDIQLTHFSIQELCI